MRIEDNSDRNDSMIYLLFNLVRYRGISYLFNTNMKQLFNVISKKL